VLPDAGMVLNILPLVGSVDRQEATAHSSVRNNPATILR
jgi:hypothetical protein